MDGHASDGGDRVPSLCTHGETRRPAAAANGRKQAPFQSSTCVIRHAGDDDQGAGGEFRHSCLKKKKKKKKKRGEGKCKQGAWSPATHTSDDAS